ncbi:PQQ-dependent sugar dehydrogenase [Sandaracinobacteroides saxicola]|uniref:Sorbosone dehydrogenase family protein n=1 Tax=Sandaracinobacteroides saxicola TaxID=2759707 RepID=A0A7G5IGA0_9SPHN|nr:sorbosone dehydrogenase family protein [Sandaracinobacteroides saxicola]QMW22392.1 sorbosone dehydrogenase family protein [Sandaracinobacteroides saxicola]
MRALLPLLLLAACSSGDAPPDKGFGANPELPAPDAQSIPVVRTVTVTGWADGQAPTPAPGWRVTKFAAGLDYPRWLYQLPNGDVLVSEARTAPSGDKGLSGKLQQRLFNGTRSQGPSANRITLLRDKDGDGIAEERHTLLEGLKQPFGMAYRPGFAGDVVGAVPQPGVLYVANTDAVLAFAFTPGATRITIPGTRIMALPAGGYNNHWTRNLLLSADGKTLFVSVGSASNIGEHGMAEEEGRAAIHALDLATGRSRLFASGLRNPVGMALEPGGGQLWTAVNERDMLGDNLVPDYMTSVKNGGFYGWPWSYYGQVVDSRVEPARPDMVAKSLPKDYALGAHTASLGLAFATPAMPAGWNSGAFIGQHGSWNRNAFAGYKVIFVPFANGKPAGPPRDVLTGFLKGGDSKEAFGRPAGVLVDAKGGLLVADDAGDTVWRVSAAP